MRVGSLWWRQVRELRWPTIGALAIVGVVTADACANMPGQPLGSWSGGIDTLAASGWPVVVGLVAFAIGMLQGGRDAAPDRRALLVHRPRSRAQIAAAILGIGALAVLAVAALPAALVAAVHRWWLPRPFLGTMLLVPALTVVATLASHAAGVWTGTMRGRWYGARLCLPATALLVIGVVATAGTQAQAPWTDVALRGIVALTLCILMASAATAAVIADGEAERVPSRLRWPVPLLAAAVGAVGLWCLLATAVPWCWTDWSYASYGVTAEGGAAVVTVSRHWRTARPLDPSRPEDVTAAAQAVRDVDRTWAHCDSFVTQPPPRPAYDIALVSVALTRPAEDNSWTEAMRVRHATTAWIVDCTQELRITPAHADRHQLFQTAPGAPSLPDHVLSYINPTYGEGPMTLIAPDGRPWWQDPDSGLLRTSIGPWKSGIPLGFRWGTSVEEAQTPRLHLICGDGTHVIDSSGTEVARILTPVSLVGLAAAKYTRLPDGGMLLLSRTGEARQTPQLLRRFDAHGGVRFSRELPVLHGSSDGGPTITGRILRLLLPPGIAWLTNGRMEYRWSQHTSVGWEAAGPMPLGPCLPVAIASAILTWLHARRQRPRLLAWAWAALSLVFGLGGLCSALVLLPRRSLTPCPSCSRPRLTDSSRCPHCGSGWPRPGDDGLSIRDPAA